MIWIAELALMLVFVGLGGFPGFIVWAVITALIMFASHSRQQAQLRAAELDLRRREMAAREYERQARGDE